MVHVKLVSCCVLGLALVSVATAQAQTYCFPDAAGVPGLSGMPTSASDPRWNGAFAYSQADNKVEFRALTVTETSSKALALMWRINGDFGNTPPNQDIITVQFLDKDSGAPTGNLIRIMRLTGAPASGCPLGCGLLAAKVYRFNGSAANGDWTDSGMPSRGFGADSPTMTPWLLNDARVAVDCSAGTYGAWTVILRVPISATATQDNPDSGLNLPDTFKFSYEVNLEHQDAMGATYATIPLLWPETISPIDWTGAPPTFPAPPTLASVKRGGGCSPNGISIVASQISVQNTTHGDATTISRTETNVFHARPTNNLAAALPKTDLMARFRIANFGSSDNWADVPAGAAVAGANVDCSAAKEPTLAGTVAPGAQFDLQCSWKLTDEQKCWYGGRAAGDAGCGSYTAATDRNPHQCIFVELRPAPGALPPAGASSGFFFSKQSAYRNMDFVAASELVRETKLELGKAPAAAPTLATRAILPRAQDVYVYIETHGMPAKVVAQPKAIVARPLALAQLRDTALVKKLDALGVPAGKIGREVATVLKEQARLGRVSHHEIAAIMPTYVAHVWRDTGRTKLAANGKRAKVLAPQASFGYYVSHDGALAGWQYGVSGTGVTKVGPNLYRMRVQPRGGLAIKSWVRACEDERCLRSPLPR